MTRRIARILVFVLLVAGQAITSGQPARASTSLPLTKLADMVVDGDHQRIFVSGGSGTSQVVMVDFDGNILGTLDNVPGAFGMQIVEGTLYVVASGAARIDRFDLSQTPPAPLTSLSTAPLTTPRDLVYAGGRLWFSSECNQWSGHIGSMALDGSDISEFVPSDFVYWTYCPRIDGGPHAPNVLFAWPNGLSPVTLYEYDVSTDPPTEVMEQRDFGGGDIEPLPGGTSFATATDAGIGEFRLSDFFGPTFTYTADTSPWAAIDVTSGEVGRLVGATGTLYETDVWAYNLGTSSPAKTFNFPDPSTGEYTVWFRGMGVSPDGSRIFVATGPYVDQVNFHVLFPNALDTSIQLSASRRLISYNQSVTVTADLDPVPPDAQVDIYMQPAGGTRTLAASGAVDPDGTFSFSRQLQKNTTFQAEFTGGGDYQPSTSVTVEVEVGVIANASLSGSYGTSGTYKLYHRGDPVPVRGKVQPNHGGDMLWFYVYRYRNGGWRYVDAEDFRLSSRSTRTAYVTGAPIGRYRTRVRFNGDADHGADWSPYRYFRVTE
jgi:hypothetical protein